MNKIKKIFQWLWMKIKQGWAKFKTLAWWLKVIVLIIIVGLLLGLKACVKPSRQAPAFRIARVEKGDVVDIVEASGPINPVNTTQVGALVSGEILKIYVDYNSEVKKGDLMAVIDHT